MPAFAAYAPGKIILFGEHAVVYSRPAIAVPITNVKARAAIQAEPLAEPGSIRIISPAIDLDSLLSDLPSEHPLVQSIAIFLNHYGLKSLPACTIRITSDIPVASGMGSGTAVSIALLRALSAFIGHPLADQTASNLAYEVEKIYHGTPSGIDNTVVTYSRPVYFIRNHSPELLKVSKPFTLLIADTGIPSSTAITVGEVRKRWEQDAKDLEKIFDQIGEITTQAKLCIEEGTPEKLGALMDHNQQLLQMLNVSCPELDNLIQRARGAGALGAKLSGGGKGGNMIALVNEDKIEKIKHALSEYASRIIVSEVSSER